MNQVVVFTIDGQCLAVLLGIVERVVGVVQITPLSNAPETVLGVINFHGEIIPVMSIRKKLGLPEREIKLNDNLIIARASKRRVALLVDNIMGMLEGSEKELIPIEAVLPEVRCPERFGKLRDGIILIHNLDEFFSEPEEKMLDKVLDKI